MAGTYRISSIIFFLWPATLVAAFFIGRLTLSNNLASVQSTILNSTENSDSEKSAKSGSVALTKSTDDFLFIIDEEIDPLLVIRQAVTESDPLKRMSILTDAFSELKKDNIVDGFALLESIEDGRLRQQMNTLLLNTWGKMDGAAAMEYAMNQESDDSGGRDGRGGRGFGRDRGGSLKRDTMAVMSGWGETNPQAAVAYAAENGTGDHGRNTMMLAALQGWAENDIAGAVNYAMDNPTSVGPGQEGRGGRGGGVENFLINRYVNENSQAATQWALSQSDPEKRNDAIGTVARSLANDSPEEAILWAQSLADPEAQAQAVRGAALGWAREYPLAAMDWALGMEDSDTSDQATRIALSTWAREDPYNASEYVIGMEAGPDKDQAASTMAQNLMRQDPEMALLWAESITDPSLQAETLAPITQDWLQKDAAQVTEWIENSSLSEEVKKQLLNQF